jgi:hypothetical protein
MKFGIFAIILFSVLLTTCLQDNNDGEQLTMPKPQAIVNNSTGNAVSVDIFGQEWVHCVMTAPGVLQRSDGFSGGNIFAVLVYVENAYFEEGLIQNVNYFEPEE